MLGWAKVFAAINNGYDHKAVLRYAVVNLSKTNAVGRRNVRRTGNVAQRHVAVHAEEREEEGGMEEGTQDKQCLETRRRREEDDRRFGGAEMLG
eukprot:766456-Hanusia_phi.AAC.5